MAVGVLALALFAIPLWYGWNVNSATFRVYLEGEKVQGLTDVFGREGATGLAAAIEARLATLPDDEIIALADPSKKRLAGNLPAWPPEIPDSPGTFGLEISRGEQSSMRMVVTHVRLPGGYHLLVGRASVMRFEALMEFFWYGVAGAAAIILVLGALVGWMTRRALLAEVQEISRTASAIAGGDLSRRVARHSRSDELDTLARTVNGMLERLAGQNVRLESEIAVRQQAEHALHQHQDDLERMIAQRTAELARANEFMEGEKRLLEMIAKGHPLLATLDALCRHVEEMSIGVLCTVLLLDSNGGRLRRGAAPSLPDSYAAAIDGWPLDAGPCGMAASLGEPVIASDIAGEERWPETRTLYSAHGLRACWSTPIVSSDGKVLGTFAMLSREPGNPTPQHQKSIEQVTHIASIAIERSRAVEELQSQKAHLNELFELAPDAIVLTTIRGPRILRINREFTRMFGYTPEEAAGRRLRDLVAPGDLFGRLILTENGDLAAGRKVEIEAIRQRKDGTRFHAHITAKLLRLQGEEDAAYLIYRDITERKDAEDKVRRSEAFLAEGQRISRTGNWGWVVSTGKVTWSEEQYRMLGFAPGEVEPSVDLFLTVVHPEDRPRVRHGLEEAIRESRSYAIDYRIVLKDGSVRHMRSVGRPVATGDGRVEEYIGVTTDTTERVQAEAALRRAQRLEATGTLAGGIAHDFNNILGAILGYGEMAQRDAPKGSRLRRDLESIMAAGERGRALVDRILTFSRSGMGERVPVHVEKVVREALDLLMANLPPSVTIKADLHAGHAAMRGDPTQIHQVVMNLATNGIQAMDAGGTLRVSLRKTRVDTQQIVTTGTIAGGDYIVLKVADSGSGIPPGILERIFDPFFSTKEVGVGTGLGLSLVHGIVTEVGGVINVETKVGAGSVFTVYLPGDGEVHDAPKDEQPELPRGGQQRILVVDDEEPLVRLATETLRGLGYMPVGFTSSTDALAAFRSDPQQFDAVVTDERMPGISGSALIREMRGIRRSIPILLVTGFVGGLVVGRAYNSGATEVLKKPLSAQELATSLARVLRQ